MIGRWFPWPQPGTLDAVTPPPQPHVVYKPGGLSGAAHAVHILICVFTCGLWLPGYILFMIFAPSHRVDVVAPAGTAPAAVTAAYDAATAPVRKERNKAFLALGVVAAVVALVCVLSWVVSAVT